MKSGIYKIECLKNGKIYIGQSNESSGGMGNRIKNHIKELSNDVHLNKYLQSDWNQIGEDQFIFSIVEKCDDSYLDVKETYWINEFNSVYPDGYNLCQPGVITLFKKAFKSIISVKKRERKIQKSFGDKEKREKIEYVILEHLNYPLDDNDKELVKFKIGEIILKYPITRGKIVYGKKSINNILEYYNLNFQLRSYQESKGNFRDKTFWIFEEYERMNK
jgi:group I intron endonuclease